MSDLLAPADVMADVFDKDRRRSEAHRDVVEMPVR